MTPICNNILGFTMQIEAHSPIEVTNLPQQIVTKPNFPWGSDQQLWVGAGVGV